MLRSFVRRSLAMVGLAAAFIASAATASSAQTIAEIEGKGRATVGVLTGIPPYDTVDASGNTDGFLVDLAREAANALGESYEFFDNIDEILDVEGIDVINFGPADYSILRRISIDYSMAHPEVEDLLTELVEKCQARGIKVMAPCIPPVAENVEALRKKGVDMIIMGNDVMLLDEGCRRAREAITTATAA